VEKAQEQQQAQNSSQRKSQALRLVEIGRRFELFHTPDGVPYASIEVNGHRETWATKSKAFGENLIRTYFYENGTVPNSQALRNAIATLDGIARFDGAEHEVHIRVAGGDQHIWVDLGNANWEVGEITPDGWRVVSNPPVRFRRALGMLPLPYPERGGSLSDLKPFLNISDVNAWSLILSWCVAAMRPDGPYPILYLLGEQGSAKSTATRVLRDLIDLFKAPLRAMPRDERDLYIAANNSRVIAFDNVSRIDPWLSDAFCRLATGGGFATRELYTDSDEVLFDTMRPMIMNGIEEAAVRGDFLERSITITLPTITEDVRRDEGTFWEAFELARPRILGLLLDGLSAALARYRTITLQHKPRMADFAIWSTAAEVGLGFEPGTFERAYSVNRQAANVVALEAMPISPYILQLIENNEEWTGTFEALLGELNRLHSEVHRKKPRGWPENPRKLSGDMKRLAPALRAVGIQYATSKPGHQNRRTLTLSKGVNTSPKSPSPAMSVAGTESPGDIAGNLSKEMASSPPTSPFQDFEISGDGEIGDVGDVCPAMQEQGRAVRLLSGDL
jgi:hypothetical protein